MAVEFHAVTGPGELLHRFRGRALIVPAQGLSVISDIDDTIKRTQVRERREMLLNTFARRFEPAPHMAAATARCARTPRHALPLPVGQSDPALSGARGVRARCELSAEGSMHLRESTTWRTPDPGRRGFARAQARRDRSPVGGLPRAAASCWWAIRARPTPRSTPGCCATTPGRIDGIVIRDVTGEGRLSERYRATFEGIDPVLWHLLRADTTAWPMPLTPQVARARSSAGSGA